jgi:hypothetical protein
VGGLKLLPSVALHAGALLTLRSVIESSDTTCTRPMLKL